MDKRIVNLIELLKNDKHFRKRIEYIHYTPPKSPVYAVLKDELPEKLKNFLRIKEIKLYSHQIEAIEKIRNGENVLITTPTSSGKSLCFNLPIFEKMIKNKEVGALYIFPTKSLTNDQLKSIKEIEKFVGLDSNASIYDGDTPNNEKSRIRNNSKIILTNPYKLHLTLQNHNLWKKFFENLNFIVLDEVHYYRGVFGSNVAYLLRRLKRICNYYGANPQFILSSATVANPKEFGEKLIGEKLSVIDKDGSPNGEKHFIFYNPFFEGIGYGENSTHTETKNLFKFFVANDCQTLCFTVSRKMAELICKWVRDEKPLIKDKIAVYRAGYMADERREIENKLKNGVLKGVTSTNALELGIDIGTLDCVIISGYPGTIISTRQQAGRAGRRNKSSLAILVAFENALDQFIMKHPDFIFDRNPENIVIDLDNEKIKLGHLLCAINELSVNVEEDIKFFGNISTELNILLKEGKVKKTNSVYICSSFVNPENTIKLNSIYENEYKLICDGKIIENLSQDRINKEAFVDAVYLNKGETYIVKEIDEQSKTIELYKKDVDYYTEPIVDTCIEIINDIYKKMFNDTNIFFGDVKVKETIIGYQIKKYDKVLSINSLKPKTRLFNTQAMWLLINNTLNEKIKKSRNLNLIGGIHGIEHAMIGLMPLMVICDRWDLGGISYSLHPQTEAPSIFIYEGIEGGIGLTRKSYEYAENLLKMTYELIKNCKCVDGCPSCIYSPKCGNENQGLHKETSLFILKEILNLK
jgi:DEAD/DEAH box helicase domain-containing protein